MSINEEPMHELIKKSFAFVQTAGMRHAPELLVLELFREIFFSPPRINPSKEVDPNEVKENGEPLYSKMEQAVINTFRGRARQKTKSNKEEKPFFLPAYPNLARGGYFRKSEANVISNFLLKAVANHLWCDGDTDEKKKEQKDFAEILIKALRGNNSPKDGDTNLKKKEILSVVLNEVPSEKIEGLDDDVRVKEKIIEKTNPVFVMRNSHDLLAERIYNDFKAICDLEGKISRMQWLELLMTFLRFSIPMWLLAQMQITGLLLKWLIKAIDSGEVIGQDEIEKGIRERNYALVQPSRKNTSDMLEFPEKYMKQRVELNCLIHRLEKIKKDEIQGKELVITGEGNRYLSIQKLLIIAQNASRELKETKEFKNVGADNYKFFLVRLAEKYPAWRRPLYVSCQGKNISELLRVLYRDAKGDELGGYLFERNFYRNKIIGHAVFPGQLLLKTIVVLAYYEKRLVGKLVLNDIENHFQQYGIDLGHAAGSRPLLIEKFQSMGLLSGSPDAGGNVPVETPFSFKMD
jgi:hypothetical protein